VAVPLGAEEGSYPVGALRRWLEAAATSEGRVFRRIDRHGNLGPTLSVGASLTQPVNAARWSYEAARQRLSQTERLHAMAISNPNSNGAPAPPRRARGLSGAVLDGLRRVTEPSLANPKGPSTGSPSSAGALIEKLQKISR